MRFFFHERGFVARRGDFEASFAIDKDHVRVEIRRLGEGFFFSVCTLAYCSQLTRDPDALLALAEAAGGYRRPDDEDMALLSGETRMRHTYAVGFACGVTVALGLAAPELPGDEDE